MSGPVGQALNVQPLLLWSKTPFAPRQAVRFDSAVNLSIAGTDHWERLDLMSSILQVFGF